MLEHASTDFVDNFQKSVFCHVTIPKFAAEF